MNATETIHKDRAVEQFVANLTREQKGRILLERMVREDPEEAVRLLQRSANATRSDERRRAVQRALRAAHAESRHKTAIEELQLAIRALSPRERAIVGMLGAMETVEEFNRSSPRLLGWVEDPSVVEEALAEVESCNDLAFATIETAYREWVE